MGERRDVFEREELEDVGSIVGPLQEQRINVRPMPPLRGWRGRNGFCGSNGQVTGSLVFDWFGLNATQREKARRLLKSILEAPDDMTELLSKRDAAGVLRVSERTVDRLVQDGEIHPVRIGRRILFRPEDVDELIRRLIDRGDEE